MQLGDKVKIDGVLMSITHVKPAEFSDPIAPVDAIYASVDLAEPGSDRTVFFDAEGNRVHITGTKIK